jgi:hypothetical protein
MNLNKGKKQEMTDRDASGKFVKGCASPNPGGRKRSDLSIIALIDEAVTDEDWKFIIGAQLKKARRGDHKAIEWLTDRRFGRAIQALEHSGKDGEAIRIEYVNSPYPVASLPPRASGNQEST